jgi:hypothetical protein
MAARPVPEVVGDVVLAEGGVGREGQVDLPRGGAGHELAAVHPAGRPQREPAAVHVVAAAAAAMEQHGGPRPGAATERETTRSARPARETGTKMQALVATRG